MKWIKENVDPDEAQIAEISQKMLENGFISRIDGKTNFESSTIPLYTFFEDKEDLADNMFRSWRGNVSGALEISCALVRLIEEVYRLSIVEMDYQTKIIAEKAIKSKKYEKYLSNV